uniref:Uncharacterized protein n=1 Tax=Anguilla anguilla TaxID=7936 RepID=A0A0E9RES5_ANGAN
MHHRGHDACLLLVPWLKIMVKPFFQVPQMPVKEPLLPS